MKRSTNDAGSHPRGSSPSPAGGARKSTGLPSAMPPPAASAVPGGLDGAETPIRILRLNSDRTRRVAGTAEYDAAFELSASPPGSWRDLFIRAWRALTPAPLWERVTVEGGFLILRCRLEELRPVHLPVLRLAVEATETAFRTYQADEAAALKRREDVWKDERKAVDEVAASLHFD